MTTEASADRYLKIGVWLRKRYSVDGFITTHVRGNVPTKYTRIDLAAWNKYIVNNTKEDDRRARRLSILQDMDESIDLAGHWEECDRCHTEARVIEDPETLNEGNFVYCRKCVAKQIRLIKAAMKPILNIHNSLRRDYGLGLITIEQVAAEYHRCGHRNFIDVEYATKQMETTN